MLNYIELCQTTPSDEPCAQVGDTNYLKRARMEVAAYMKQLTRNFGIQPTGCFFKVVPCPHDFGTYLDLRLTKIKSM